MWRTRLLCAQCCWLFASVVCGAQLHPAWVLWSILPSSITAGAVTGACAAGPAGCAIGGGLASIVRLHSLFYQSWQQQHEAHHWHPQFSSGRRPTRPKRKFEAQLDWAAMRDFLSEKEFRLMFGLSSQAFDYVLSLIKDDIKDTPTPGRGGIHASDVVLPEIKLAVTLRWLRGAQYHDLYYAYGMSRATFYRTWRRVCVAILKQPAMGLSLMPAIEAWRQGNLRPLSELATGFGRFTNGIFQFCVGAIDGVQVQIKRPSMAEDEAPNGYYTRRGIHAINVQAAADDRGRITWASLRAPGGMHDGQACSLSDLFSILVAGAGCWFFVGDDAYVGKPYMATPFGGTPATGSKEDNYNYYQALTRQPIERAFGMVERRWGILWRRLEVPLRHVELILYTIFCLHNVCMDYNVPVPPLDALGQDRFRALERCSDVLKEQGRRTDREQSVLRQQLADELAKYGMCRPPVEGVRRGAA